MSQQRPYLPQQRPGYWHDEENIARMNAQSAEVKRLAGLAGEAALMPLLAFNKAYTPVQQWWANNIVTDESNPARAFKFVKDASGTGGTVLGDAAWALVDPQDPLTFAPFAGKALGAVGKLAKEASLAAKNARDVAAIAKGGEAIYPEAQSLASLGAVSQNPFSMPTALAPNAMRPWSTWGNLTNMSQSGIDYMLHGTLPQLPSTETIFDSGILRDLVGADQHTVNGAHRMLAGSAIGAPMAAEDIRLVWNSGTKSWDMLFPSGMRRQYHPELMGKEEGIKALSTLVPEKEWTKALAEEQASKFLDNFAGRDKDPIGIIMDVTDRGANARSSHDWIPQEQLVENSGGIVLPHGADQTVMSRLRKDAAQTAPKTTKNLYYPELAQYVAESSQNPFNIYLAKKIVEHPSIVRVTDGGEITNGKVLSDLIAQDLRDRGWKDAFKF